MTCTGYEIYLIVYFVVSVAASFSVICLKDDQEEMYEWVRDSFPGYRSKFFLVAAALILGTLYSVVTFVIIVIWLTQNDPSVTWVFSIIFSVGSGVYTILGLFETKDYLEDWRRDSLYASRSREEIVGKPQSRSKK